MKNLLELKLELKERKENFDKYRISNGDIEKINVLVKEKHSFEKNLENLISEQSIEKADNQIITTQRNDTITSGEDNVKAVKPYSEKIKGGYFGKRRSRF